MCVCACVKEHIDGDGSSDGLMPRLREELPRPGFRLSDFVVSSFSYSHWPIGGGVAECGASTTKIGRFGEVAKL